MIISCLELCKSIETLAVYHLLISTDQYQQTQNEQNLLLMLVVYGFYRYKYCQNATIKFIP